MATNNLHEKAYFGTIRASYSPAGFAPCEIIIRTLRNNYSHPAN